MDEDKDELRPTLSVGDVVSEDPLIVPPDRKPWVGIVVYKDKASYRVQTTFEDLEVFVGVYWFQNRVIEQLPASVIVLIQSVKFEENA